MILTLDAGLESTLDRLIADCLSLGLIDDASYGDYDTPGWRDRQFLLSTWGATCLNYLTSSARAPGDPDVTRVGAADPHPPGWRKSPSR